MMKIKPDVRDKIHSARQRSVEQTASRMERTYGQEVIAIKKRLILTVMVDTFSIY